MVKLCLPATILYISCNSLLWCARHTHKLNPYRFVSRGWNVCRFIPCAVCATHTARLHEPLLELYLWSRWRRWMYFNHNNARYRATVLLSHRNYFGCGRCILSVLDWTGFGVWFWMFPWFDLRSDVSIMTFTIQAVLSVFSLIMEWALHRLLVHWLD